MRGQLKIEYGTKKVKFYSKEKTKMKKKLVTSILMAAMVIGLNTNVYAETVQTETTAVARAASYGSSFNATQLQLNGESHYSDSCRHQHDYIANILCYNVSYTKSITKLVNYGYIDTGKTFSSVLLPSVYSDSTYTGRYFKGNQSCQMIYAGQVTTHSKVVG